MTPSARVVLHVILLLAGIWGGCARPDGPAERSAAPKTTSPREEADIHTFTGTVEVVEAEEGVVSIRHGDIPGLMPAMLMDFQPADKSLLEDLLSGDEVQGKLKAQRGPSGELSALELIDLVVTRPAIPQPPPPARSTQNVLKPGQAVPDFQVTTQEGLALRLSDLRGKVVVLTFVYTRCPLPSYCPLMDQKFQKLAEMVNRTAERRERIRLLSVSFDPEHDTPAILSAHASQVGARPPVWTYSVASHEELSRVAPSLGLSYSPLSGEIRHDLSTSVIGPDGTLLRLAKGNDWAPEEVFSAIRSRITPP